MTSYLKQANEAFRKKEYLKAISFYEKALEDNPAMEKVINFNLNLAQSKAKLSIPEKIENRTNCNPIDYFSKKNSAIVKFDSINNNLARGWAMDLRTKNCPIVLKVSVDGVPNSLVETCILRNDVKNEHGGDGFFGYSAELSPYLNFSQESKVQIIPISHNLDKNSKNTTEKLYPSVLKGVHFKDVNNTACTTTKKLIYYPKLKQIEIKVSVIILNLNGMKVIYDCIDSILKWNRSCDVIVIDHGSTDNSISVIENFRSERIKLIKRDKNYSYSDSNNLGAKQAVGDVLIFLNNDIVLTSDSITTLANIVNQTDFGLMGIKLWDFPKGNGFQIDDTIRINQHLGVHFNGLSRKNIIEAFELRSPSFINLEKGILETPAVTAAMVAIKKGEFEKLEGFNDKYFYGQEDVDLCLRYYRDIGRKTGVLLDEGAYHIRGLSRRDLSQNNKSYIGDNRKVIQSELGSWFRQEFRKGLFKKPGFWNQKPLSVAMIVSEVSFETDKADFFTAKELGDSFEEYDNAVVGYFDISSDYNVAGYDLVIVYIDGFDPRRLKNLSPHTILIGWARNWFDRWCERVWIEHYDYLYASSEKAKKYMEKTLKRKVGLLRIAASNNCVKGKKLQDEKYTSDYVFTGSYFNSPCEITDLLEPKKIPYKFKLFGYNWENHEKFKNYTDGPVSYKEIPSVYANTKVVIDDANIATKRWGSVNCRVFDALSMGIPCITNNTIGVAEIFDEEFPVYSSEKVNDNLKKLLSNDHQRKSLGEKYKKMVLEQHTYQNRRDQILADVECLIEKKFLAIKIAAPDFERGITWGDYHFAKALRFELEKLNIKVRIDCLDQWYGERSLNDDVNLVLRGLSRFKGREDQLNLMWLISHPDMVCEEELRDFNHIFVASDYYTEKLKFFTEMQNISFLPQASSFSVDQLDPQVLKEIPEHDILFVGNSRNEYREVVKWCIEEGLPISVYGSDWEQFISSKYIKGQFIDNNLLPYYYHKAKVVLNDHWKDMREKGFVSNRVFDILAVNGLVITDDAFQGEFFSNSIFIYKDKKDFINAIKNASKEKNEINDRIKIDFKYRALNIYNLISE